MLRRHEGNWNFGSSNFTVDCLFGPNGIRDENGKRLKPVRWTDSTKNLKDESQRIPSTSAKDHLPYFEHVEFVRDLMAYSKLTKLRSTYVGAPGRVEFEPVRRLASGKYTTPVMAGMEASGFPLPISKAHRHRTKVYDFPASEQKEITLTLPSGKNMVDRTYAVDAFGNLSRKEIIEPSGFWNHIDERSNNIIHSSFVLHATNTGRTASRGPNLQNTPKRGEMAKVFRRVFRPPIAGWKFLELDYSQIELRIAAWEANEQNMIGIYRSGGDIHAFTAAAVIGVNPQKFAAGRKDETPLIEVADAWPTAGALLRSLSPGERTRFTVAEFCDLKRFQAKAVNWTQVSSQRLIR